MIIMKKKILVFHPSLAPYRVDFFNSINENFDAKFYFFNKNVLSQKFDLNEINKLKNFNCYYLDNGFYFLGRNFRFGINKIIKNNQPDIIICTEYNLVNLYSIFYRFFSQKKFKIVSIVDDNIQMANSISFLKKLLRYFQIKHLDYILLTHNEINNWYKSNLSLKSKILLSPIIRREDIFLRQLKSSIPFSENIRTKYKLNNKKTFLFVGRLVSVKNIERLLKAFALVVKVNDDVRLLIVGSGELESSLFKIIQNLFLDNHVFIVGRYDGINLYAWYLASDVFILPSTYEPFGAVVNEALLSGCYVLVSKLSGASSLIKENINGNIFNPYSIKDIADIINHSIIKKELFTRHSYLRPNKMLYSFHYYMKILTDEFNQD
jgi:glycosyltransferase involved in cell wall biosynthesis